METGTTYIPPFTTQLTNAIHWTGLDPPENWPESWKRKASWLDLSVPLAGGIGSTEETLKPLKVDLPG